MSLDQWTALAGPAIAAAIVVVGGVWAYKWQKDIDRKTALVELRRATYQELLASLNQHLRKGTKDAQVSLGDARSKAIVVAPDEVGVAIGRFFNVHVMSQESPVTDGKMVLEAFADMIIAMRRDCFEKTDLSVEEIIDISPVELREDRSK